jgi:hypothetical protein
VSLLRFASMVICLIVIASFIVFAANQAKSASNHQQELLGTAPSQVAVAGSARAAATPAVPHESTLHRTLDEASAELTSPFSSLLSGASGEWAVRGLKLLAALIVYGFGLGYLARALRVRV